VPSHNRRFKSKYEAGRGGKRNKVAEAGMGKKHEGRGEKDGSTNRFREYFLPHEKAHSDGGGSLIWGDARGKKPNKIKRM